MANPYQFAKRTAWMAAIFVFAASFSAQTPSTWATPDEPWTSAQTVQAVELVKELQQEKDAAPTVIYVGVKALYAGAHIPGALYHGPGSTEQGISDLKTFAATLPKDANVVIYCGCCPMEKCPNLRPAFSALKGMGVTRLRVLVLPNNFNADWVEKGYPIRKGDTP